MAQNGTVKGFCVLLVVLGGLVLAGPAARAGEGAEVRGIIQKVEELRGLRTGHPLAVSTLDAVAMRGVVARLLERERGSETEAGWDDALHLLGVLRPGQRLAQVERGALAGQVAGLYVPRTRRLYVLGSGGSAPRAVVAHEVVHALQDAHFQLTRGPLAPRPRDHDGELAAQALVEGDATDVQSRYVASLSPLDLVGELGRTLGALPGGASAKTAPFLERQLLFPYTAGLRFVRALRARGGQRLLDRAFRNPPRTTAAVLDPARYLAGDPPPQAVRLPAGSYRFATSFGAEDLVALTGEGSLGRFWLGGRMGVGRRGLDMRLATRGAASVAAALRRALPASAAIVFHGRLVCVRIALDKASVRGVSCR
ncbi:MAG: hypothetical protein QOE87_4329 [Gaiellales bacterium]|nr:hypothetical protein [Gaiellales bacterium]